MGTIRLLLERTAIPPDLIGKISDYLLSHDILRLLKTNDRGKIRNLMERAFQDILKRSVPQQLLDELETG